eukprot:1422882-Pyramimonas_sp.AAC.1
MRDKSANPAIATRGVACLESSSQEPRSGTIKKALERLHISHLRGPKPAPYHNGPDIRRSDSSDARPQRSRPIPPGRLLGLYSFVMALGPDGGAET